ncbi:MAG: serine hydrolase [Bacteroidia bacterium]|nr:serine hydrolase [Bacteroidia bacterium]
MKTPRKILSNSLFLILFLSTSSYGQSRIKLPDDVVNSIEKRIEFGLNPSIVVGIIDKNGPHYFNFGKKSDNGSEANEHTIYEIGSISKVFTATLLSQQVIDGKLKLDDPIKNYLPPQVKIPQRGESEITFGNLSDHTSGLPRLPSNMSPSDPGNPYADYTVDQMYSFLSGYKLTRDVGSAYEYSNLAQGLLGHILALNAGVTYESLMIKTIARPLGMKETKITLDKKMKKNLAIGHDKGVVAKNWDLPTLSGAGAIRSSTHDMLKFISANLGFLKTPLQAAMKKTHEVRHDKAGNMRVGLGWHIAKGKNGDVIWHNGGTGGYMAFAGFVKETGEGVVLLTNSTESVDDIGFHLLNPESLLRIIKPSIASEIRKTIDVNGVEAAKALFYDLKKNKPDEYNFSEEDINTLGYSYMDKNLTAALAIFKMNIDMYPNSSNVYDSYGEALLKNGDKDLAIENYKKSVELNPANTGGIQALEKLGVKIQVENVEVPETTLDTYAGSYELNPGFNILITRDGKQLFGQATGQGKFELFAKSNREFYLKVVNAQIIFNVNEQAAVESLTLIQNGQKITGKKIN